MSEKSIYDFCGLAFFFKTKTLYVYLQNNAFICVIRSRDFRWSKEDKLKIEEHTNKKGQWEFAKVFAKSDDITAEQYVLTLKARNIKGAMKEAKDLAKDSGPLQLTHYYYDNDARITIQDHNGGIYTAHAVGKNHKKVMKKYLLRLQGCDLLTDVEENDYRVKFKLTGKAKANLLASLQAIADLCPGTIVL